ncbi:MAG TPA: formyltransferase family protein, partial [Spirochaetota bacterium]|nr:formyltransferase family protein [Spirochaetota bacterium]
MKIGFFGTPEIGAYCLESLAKAHDIVFAVSQEDKPQGRSLRMVRSPVSSVAERLGIPVFTPKTLKDETLPGILADFGADIFVVVAYG